MPAEGLALRARANLSQFDDATVQLIPANGINTFLALTLVTAAKCWKITYLILARDTVTGNVVAHQARVIVAGGAVPAMVAAAVEFSSSNIGAFTPLFAQGVGGLFSFISVINPIGGNPVNFEARTILEDGP